MGISQVAYMQMLARQRVRLKGGQLSSATGSEPVERERDLHDDIKAECSRRGWIALHGRMDMATGRTVGEPDFTIVTERGVYFVECKTRTGKITHQQAAMLAWMRKLGQDVHIVRSLEEFLSVIFQ